MAAFFVTPKGVILTLPPVPKFPFHAIVFWKMEEGIDKLCLHVRNDVLSTVDNKQNAIKFTKVFSQLLKNLNSLLKERRKFIPNVDG